jgi:hypothetical protein
MSSQGCNVTFDNTLVNGKEEGGRRDMMMGTNNKVK